MENAWSRMLESDYNRRYYVEKSQRYKTISQWMNWIVAVLSTSAFVTLFSSAPAIFVQILAALAAMLATSEATFGLSAKAGNCEAQAVLWSKMVSAFETLHQRERMGDPGISEYRAIIHRDFSYLCEQDQQSPSMRVKNRLYNEVLESFGYPVTNPS